MFFKKLLLGLFILISGFVFAFDMGGKGNGQNTTPPATGGAVYSLINTIPSYSSCSNTVNVATLRILMVTSNLNTINPGNTIAVAMGIRNTSGSNNPMNLTPASAEIWAYRTEFGSITVGDPDAYRLDNNTAFTGIHTPTAPLPTIAAGATVTLNFSITVTANQTSFNQIRYPSVVVDGYVPITVPAINDHWWSAALVFSGKYRYAADVTANWNLSGPPYVLSIAVSPNPAPAGPVTVTVNFSRLMNTAIQPSINYRVNGVTHNIFGAWASANTNIWVGNFVVPPNQYWIYDGIASVAALSAVDNIGRNLAASYNVGTFEIDTVKPTASLVIATTTNIGVLFPVTLVATDRLRTTPNITLSMLGRTMIIPDAAVNFTSQIGRVTWNGTVQIHPNTRINSIATFNVVGFYYDDAGNTNNVLTGRITVNIQNSAPLIVSVSFDGIDVANGSIISSRPEVISVNIIDYKGVGLRANSVRVTVDGGLVYSGPAAIIQQAAFPPLNIYYFTFTFPYDLSTGQHTFEFGIADNDTPNVQAIPFIVSLEVASRELELLRDPVPFPNPFSPNDDGVDDFTQIVYELSRSADITIYIYDMNGDLVWRNSINKGQEGGHVGVNRVVWTGESTFGNSEVLPNGIYICHIIAKIDGEKRSLGRTKIYILN